MKPELTAEWKRLSRAEKEQRILAALLDGNLLKVSVPEKLTRGPEATFPEHTINEYIEDWRRRGFLTGFVPRLSEDGQRYFDGLAAVVGPSPKETYAESTSPSTKAEGWDLSGWLVGGIPPDPDQRVLNRCCFKAPLAPDQCPVTADEEPLVVGAMAGRLRVLCHKHFDQLVQMRRERR